MNNEKLEAERFWMVYGIGRSIPTFRHASGEDAHREARRLAMAHPGERFFVLKSTGGYVANQPVQEITLTDPVPF